MKQIFLTIVAAVILCSCSTSSEFTRAKLYPKMYEEKPKSILVMPPINQTTHAEAKEYFYASMVKPLCEKGYYVISPFMAMDIMKQESAYDSEYFINGSLKTLQNFFGTDAVLFTIIKKWEKQSALSYITVGVEYQLKSAKTGEVLFKRTGELQVDFSTQQSGNGSALGALLSLAADMITTATTDKIIVARRCNKFVFADMPDGIYSPNYGKDMDFGANKSDFKATVKN